MNLRTFKFNVGLAIAKLSSGYCRLCSRDTNTSHDFRLSSHMTDELERYDRWVTIVNLINRTGSEGALEKNFNRYLIKEKHIYT